MDILGNTRNASSEAEIVSSEYARIVIGKQVSLCQSFQATYQQQVTPVFEIGSPEVRWSSGFASGTANISNIVGKNGFFKGFGAQNCGRINTMSITANQGQPCATFTTSGRGSLRFRGGVMVSYALQITAGRVEIVASASMRFAGLEED